MKLFYRIVVLIVFVVVIFLSVNIFHYLSVQKNNEKYIEQCSEKNEKIVDLDNSVGVINKPNSCFCRMYTYMLPRLLVHKVKSNNKELEFIRPSQETCILPTLILEKADAFLSYGIDSDVTFEYLISELYKKNIYIHKYGPLGVESKNKYMFFDNECLEADSYVVKLAGKPTRKIHTFCEKLKKLNLEDKKVYLKINIMDFEYEVLPSVLKYHKNLTGFTLDLIMNDSDKIIKYEKLFKEIDKNFVLVARNEGPIKKQCDCNYKSKYLSPVISLTYVNKEYIDKDYVPFKQSYHRKGDYKQFAYPGFILFDFNMSWKLILSEKIKLLLENFNEKFL